MLKVARNSVQKSLLAGVTLIRDAGDIHGINTTIRAELEQTNGLAPNLQIAGIAIRKTGRYGSFMAREVNDAESLLQAIRSLASNVDHLKILMTGIIDFKLGKVKGSPQFTLEEAGLIVKTARELDLPTFAHCSGLKGIQTAVEAGIDSIEHGFFINRQVLQKMADKQIAWVPTFSPVDFQWARPELAGWDAETVQKLRNILDSHNEHLLMAEELGVPLVAGSDAGSYGVEHGMALIDELIFMAQAGLPLQSVLQSATSRPRKCWGVTSADIQKGTSADLILLEESPFTSVQNLKKVQTILKDGFVFNQALAVY
jgi:imidazolonepropionase-like amidohydrolase